MAGDAYNGSRYPDGPRSRGLHGGQDGNSVSLGAGDFSIFPNTRDGSITGTICVARSPLSSQGVPGAWKKLHNGEFRSDGNCGQETPALTGGYIPFVTYNEHLDRYLMNSYNRPAWTSGRGALQFSYSDDLVSWSEPKLTAPEMPELSLPYFTQLPLDTRLHTTGQEFQILGESNGTDVTLFRIALR